MGFLQNDKATNSDIAMTFQNDQLVLHRVGDENESLKIINDKCLLRSRLQGQLVDSCAIFVGPYGSALRSYCENVRVNGEVATARWIRVGDQIKLPCNTTLEVRSAPHVRLDTASPPPSSEQQTGIGAIVEEANPTRYDVASEPPAKVTNTVESERSEAQPAMHTERVASLTAIFANLGLVDDEEKTTGSELQSLPPVSDQAEFTEAPQVKPEVTADTETPKAVDGAAVAFESETAQAADQHDPVTTVDQDSIEAKKAQLEVLFGPVGSSATQPAESQPAESQPADSQPAKAEPTLVDPTVADTEQPIAAEQKPFGRQVAATIALSYLTDKNSAAIDPAESATAEVELTSPEPEAVDPASGMEAPFANQTPVQVDVSPVPEAPQEESNLGSGDDADSLLERLGELAAAAGVARDDNDASQQTLTGGEGLTAVQSAPLVDVIADTAGPQENSEEFTAEEPIVAADAVSNSSPGVADILGKMGFQIPTDDNDDGVAEPVVPQPEVAPVVSTPAAPINEGDAAEGEDDIQAYMNRLLNRGGEEVAPKVEATDEEDQPPVPVAPVMPAPIGSKAEEEEAVLTPEEFVPKVKAQRVDSFDTLREIANQSSRNAIQHSVKRSEKESRQVKTGLFIASVLGTILFFLFGLKFAMMGFAAAAFATSYVFYQEHVRRNQPPKKKDADQSAAMDEPGSAIDGVKSEQGIA